MTLKPKFNWDIPKIITNVDCNYNKLIEAATQSKKECLTKIVSAILNKESVSYDEFKLLHVQPHEMDKTIERVFYNKEYVGIITFRQTVFDFNSTTDNMYWSFIPKTIFKG